MVEQRSARFDSGRSPHCFSGVLPVSIAIRTLGQVEYDDDVRLVRIQLYLWRNQTARPMIIVVETLTPSQQR